MRKIIVKNKILSLFLMLFLLSNVVLNNVQAIEFDPSNNGDDETNKEYTAKLLDLQINTLMPLEDDEFGGYDEFNNVQDLSLIGSIQINKKDSNSYLENLPEVNLVDEDNNIVAIPDIYCESELTGEPSDIYYISFYNLDIQEGQIYKLLATINDNNNIISKYVTYSDELVYSPGGNTNMYYESKNNILNISFEIITPLIKGDLNNDAVVNANDAAIVLDLYKYNNASDEDLYRADIDGNGVINANDAALILDIYKYGN